MANNPKAQKKKKAEDLIILPHQMFKPKIEGTLQADMIKRGCLEPDQNIARILDEDLSALGSHVGQKKTQQPQNFQTFGMSIDPRMLAVPAHSIKIPQLQFANEVFTIPSPRGKASGKWQLAASRQFLDTSRTVNMPGNPFFLLSRPYPNIPDSLQYFWQHYRTNGTPDIGQLPVNFNLRNSQVRQRWRRADFEAAQSNASGQGASIVVLILPENNKINQSQYGDFKAVMDQTGMLSLCLCENKLKAKMRGRQDSLPASDARSDIANYAYNVGMKLNIRLGNANHSLVSSNFSDLQDDTLILGADVIHPGLSSVEGTPSIAAVVGSVDNHYSKYQEIIDGANMRAMVHERLEAWKAINGCYPSNILYYRDGVGDSQFTEILTKEVTQIRSAYADATVNTSQQGHKPKITAAVVVKRHNTRFYPRLQEKTSGTGNVLPGTVVDSGITHPYNFDFFLVSHEGLQGTARPTHYTVLLNEMDFDAEGIQDLTNGLCFTYQRSTTSVSYVPPAYYADHLCERGRCYLQEFFDGSERVRGMTDQQVAQRIQAAWTRGGRGNGNPWNAALDGTMFWM